MRTGNALLDVLIQVVAIALIAAILVWILGVLDAPGIIATIIWVLALLAIVVVLFQTFSGPSGLRPGRRPPPDRVGGEPGVGGTGRPVDEPASRRRPPPA